jgi:transcriptional regulator with PAS, ATPase and Fis domain
MEMLAELIGQSPEIEALRGQVRRLLQLPAGHRRPPVLLLGETGTGKGLVARLLHQEGPRALGPVSDVNCAAIPETLLEAELFGFERGAFTGAAQAKPGLIQAARNGTLFLDEVETSRRSCLPSSSRGRCGGWGARGATRWTYGFSRPPARI